MRIVGLCHCCVGLRLWVGDGETGAGKGQDLGSHNKWCIT